MLKEYHIWFYAVTQHFSAANIKLNICIHLKLCFSHMLNNHWN